MNRTAIRLLAAMTAFGCAAPVAAADFTFDVPVRVDNLPSLTSIGVQCAVYTAYPAGSIIAVSRSVPVPVSGGSYAGTVVVEVNNGGLTPSSDARAYGCALTGEGTGRTGTRYGLSPDNFADVYTRATGHSLVSPNNQVRGPIP